jgi:hypothetical protein
MQHFQHYVHPRQELQLQLRLPDRRYPTVNVFHNNNNGGQFMMRRDTHSCDDLVRI